MDLRNTPMSRVSKADMAKTLKIRFSMIETNPLNHKWLDFVILMGLALHQFKKKWLLRELLYVEMQLTMDPSLFWISTIFIFRTQLCKYLFTRNYDH